MKNEIWMAIKTIVAIFDLAEPSSGSGSSNGLPLDSSVDNVVRAVRPFVRSFEVVLRGCKR